MALETSPRVAILDDYQDVALSMADWTSLKDRVHIDTYRDTLADEDALVDRLKFYQILVLMRERTKMPKSLLDRLPNLRFIATTGPYNAGIDVAHANSRGILVSGTENISGGTIEHIIALILATTRYISSDDQNIKSSNPVWQSYIPLGLSGRTLGILGLGRLGIATANIAKVFGMDVIAWSPNLTKERADAAQVGFASTKEEFLKGSDVLSVHMVLSEESKHVISGADLALMKPSAFLINTSRGPLVDEDALITALQKGTIAGAGLDVFDQEPLPLDHPLRQLGHRVTLTPHTAYVNETTYKTWWKQTVENIEAFLDGEPKRKMRTSRYA